MTEETQKAPFFVWTTFEVDRLARKLKGTSVHLSPFTRFPFVDRNQFSLKSGAFHLFLISADVLTNCSAESLRQFRQDVQNDLSGSTVSFVLLPSARLESQIESRIFVDFWEDLQKNEFRVFDGRNLFLQLAGQSYQSPSYFFLTGCCYSKAYIDVLADFIRHMTEFSRFKKKKLLIFDLDGTLWPGVLSENPEELYGSENSDREVYFFLQSEIRSLKNLGYSLALLTKNHESEVEEVLKHQKASAFKRSDFDLISAQWTPKDQQMGEILAALQVSPDQTIYFDNDLRERSLIQSRFPEIETLPPGPSPLRWALDLKSKLGFWNPFITNEDLLRSRSIQANLVRDQLRQKQPREAQWLSELRPTLGIEPLGTTNFKRAQQLLTRTNQFKTNPSWDVPELMISGATAEKTYLFSYQDRLGDDGQVGLVSFRLEDERVFLLQILLSCRAFGRRVEEAMMFWLHQQTNRRIEVFFQANGRNEMAKRFLTNPNYFEPVRDNVFCLKPLISEDLPFCFQDELGKN